MTKDKALNALVEARVSIPHGWGSSDCCLYPCDWVMDAMGVDPASDFRGRYRTPLGAARLVARRGGLEPMWAEGMARAGLARTDRPIAGDVGLCRRETRDGGPTLSGLVGAICLGGGVWSTVSSQGVMDGRWPVVAAWRVNWRRRRG